MRGFVCVGVIVSCWVATSASGAGAATNLGATFAPDDCPTNTTWIQTADPTNAYRVPADGVITRWSYQATASAPTTAKLKIGRVAPDADLTMAANVSIVGESAPEATSANVLNSYPTRISVKAGDRIGEYLNGIDDVDTPCSRLGPTFSVHYFDADASLGSTQLFSQDNFQQDIAAVWEPDADHDGFGDETQDKCSTNGATQGACPRKCKKKHKSDAVIAKKCKKRKKHKGR